MNTKLIPFEIQERIQYVLDHFNFDKVHRTMTALQWKWVNSTLDKHEVPSLGLIKVKARYLLDCSYNGLIKSDTDYFTTGTGGLEATCFKEGTGYEFTLKFVLTEADSELCHSEVTANV